MHLLPCVSPVIVRSVDCRPTRSTAVFTQISPLFPSRFTETCDSCHAPMPWLLLLIQRGPDTRVTAKHSAVIKFDNTVHSIAVYVRPCTFFKFLYFLFLLSLHGDRGSTVVKVLCYKSEGRWFDSRWCHWKFSLK